MLATHLHLVQWSRMNGAKPPLPVYAVLFWTGTPLFFLFFSRRDGQLAAYEHGTAKGKLNCFK